jgi:hypothetical protein
MPLSWVAKTDLWVVPLEDGKILGLLRQNRPQSIPIGSGETRNAELA